MNKEKEQQAIKYLKTFEPQDGYYLCYSGGKDSDCIRILAELAGVKHEIHHNLTTVDAPETVRYIRSIPNIIIDRPPKSMRQLIIEKGVPTRIKRFCCAKLKERGGEGRLKVTGVRWAESVGRKQTRGLVDTPTGTKANVQLADDIGVDYHLNSRKGIVMNMDDAPTRRFVEQCYRTSSVMVNPIVDWTDADVWEFLHHYGCKSNPLYAEGHTRIGCVGCPLSGPKNMKQDFARWPQFKKMYISAFDAMLKRREERQMHIPDAWKDAFGNYSGETVMAWWLGDNIDQLEFDFD